LAECGCFFGAISSFAETGGMIMTELAPLADAAVPVGIRSRFVDGINGLRMHILEAGFEGEGRPCVVLLHGFPELAFSWRKVMLPLASAGFHVIAPDQRGYGRTTGWDAAYHGDLRSFRLLNIARDTLGLVAALGYPSVAAVVGHDFGSPVAAWCALVRPDVFQSVVLMSAPFPGPPSLPFNTASGATDSRAKSASSGGSVHEQLARLDPPRKHYQWYYSTREANADMHDAPQGVHDFLRAYYHYKSADWARNDPVPLKSFTAGELAKLPTYYIMELHKGMAATVAPEMPSPAEIASCRWLTEQELKVYSTEYLRTGFQGGLNWYRCRTQNVDTAELEFFSGRQIEVPSLFIAGRKDWGIYQVPGSIERMQHSACTHMRSCILVEGAGHWVQQEQPQQVSELLLEFLRQRDR
jgi:pimeloyl-ACP methyl ester carboxylesterase